MKDEKVSIALNALLKEAQECIDTYSIDISSPEYKRFDYWRKQSQILLDHNLLEIQDLGNLRYAIEKLKEIIKEY